jgi:hypothetical protein
MLPAPKRNRMLRHVLLIPNILHGTAGMPRRLLQWRRNMLLLPPRLPHRLRPGVLLREPLHRELLLKLGLHLPADMYKSSVSAAFGRDNHRQYGFRLHNNRDLVGFRISKPLWNQCGGR